MSLEGSEILQLTPNLLNQEVLVDIHTIQLLRERNKKSILVAHMDIRHVDMAERCHIVRQEVASAGSIGFVGTPGEMIYYAFGGNSLVPDGQKFQEDPEQTKITIDLLERLLQELGKSGVYIYG